MYISKIGIIEMIYEIEKPNEDYIVNYPMVFFNKTILILTIISFMSVRLRQ